MTAVEIEKPVGTNGLPLLTEEEVQKGGNPLVMIGIFCVGRVVGFLLAWPVFHFANETGKTAQLGKIADHGFLYLSAYCFSILVGWLNLFPMIHKERLRIKGNVRANMQFYKVLDGPGRPQNFPLIGLEEDGAVGQYNRANRSVGHFVENMGIFVVCVFPAGFILPLQTFVLTIVYCLGRVVHQIGYVSGYGTHVPGFLSATVSSYMIEGIVLWSALSALA